MIFPEGGIEVVSLSDCELRTVMEAAKPPQPHQRSAFLTDVAAELSKYPKLGRASSAASSASCSGE